MQFKTLFFTVAVGVFGQDSDHTGACSTGTAQCCSQIYSPKEAKSALAGLGIAFNEAIAGTIGLDCQQIPIGVIAVPVALQNTCKNTAVCCEGSANNGLIQTSCTPLSVN